ncbi:MAG: hypothetical protein ACO3GN_05800 [Bacteroidia bacterium]
MSEIRVTKATSVLSLKRQFATEFSCTLVIYKPNNTIADDDQKIHELAKDNYSGGSIEIGPRSKVGNVEAYFEKEFGIKVQIKNSDGKWLASNDMTLSQAGKG